MKTFYKSLGILIWAIGIALFALAMRIGGIWDQQILQLVTILFMGIAGIFVIFSFLYGAQPGHYVRFVMITLFSILCLLMFLNETKVFTGTWYRLVIIVDAGIMMLISHKFKQKFLEEYKSKGKVDYFEVYFGRNSQK